VAQETTLYVVALALCCGALLIIAGMFVSNLLEEYAPRDRQSKFIAIGVGFVVVAGMALFLGRSMVRLWRFRAWPVRIVLEDGSITLSDPVRLGHPPRVLPLTQLRRCNGYRVESGRYAIVVTKHGARRRIRVDVAAHEGGVVERAAADLQRAIDRANGKN
jgi:hypothetical protein